MTAVTRAPDPAAAGPGAAGRLGAAVPLLPGIAVSAVWLWWAVHGGGYFPGTWYPGGLLAAGLLLTLALARPPGAFVRSPAVLPLALLAAWTAWNALSLAWSDAPGSGREATNQLLTVVVMGAVLAATPWRPRSALLVLGLWAGGVAAVAAIDLAAFALAARPQAWLLESRYLGPTGYANGTAALGAMAFWPLLALAARTGAPAAVRVAALPAAVVVILWALLPQSRGTMLAGVAVAPLFLALSPDRSRALARLAVVGGALALCVPALFEVYTASREGRPLAGVVDTAVIRVGVAAALALAASLALVAFEGRVRVPAGAGAALRRAAPAVAVAAVLACAVGAALSYDRLAASASDRWETFSSDASAENTQTGARLGQLTADKRYDYWRVAVDAFRERPIAGLGAGGFEPRYTAEKAYAKHSRYAHDVWLRALSETGVVGLALLLAALGAGLAGAVRVRRRGVPEAAAPIAAATALSAAFFLQCSLDWLEQMPALLAPAVGLPLVALRAGAAGAARSARRPAGAAAALVLALVTLAALALPYLAIRQLDRGDALRVSDPPGALEAYDRAAGADPLSLDPHLRTGFLGLRLRDAAIARRGFREAVALEENWVAHFELGLLDAQAGRFAAARDRLRRAGQLNANDPIVVDALTAVEDGERLDPLEVNRRVREEPVLAAPP